MKTITIRLPDVEAAMLVEVQKADKEFRNLEKLLARLIVGKYEKTLR
jgi:hypothetical protein